MQILLNSLRALLLVALIWAIWHVTKRLDDTLADVSRFTQSATGVSADLRKIAGTYEQQANEQAAAITATTKGLTLVTIRAGAALDQLNVTIAKVGGAADNLNEQITTLGMQSSSTVTTASNLIVGIQSTNANLNLAAANLAKLTADPSLDSSLANLNRTTAHVDATAADIQEAADLALVRFKQAMRPKSLALNIFEHLLGLAGPGVQIATAVK